MDKETKITYITIGALIIILGSVAFFLQNNNDIPTTIQEETKHVAKKVVQTPPKTTTSTSTATTTLTHTLNSTSTSMPPSQKITRGVITTNKGIIEISFSGETPNTVKNFVTLAQAKFYDGVRFHRVIKDFMIQAGDPLSKDTSKISTWGSGGPGYSFNDELTGKEQYTFGTLAMANAGPNTNGSQFFIVTANPVVPLPPSYTVFGKVTKGMDIAMKIQEVKTTGSPSDRPLEDVIIEKIEVME